MPRSAEQCLAVGREYYIKKYYQKRWENDSFKKEDSSTIQKTYRKLQGMHKKQVVLGGKIKI